MAIRPTSNEIATRRRREILSAATPIFASRGFRRTDVQEIADELHVGKGTVYRYFPSKQELFFAVADQGLADLMAAIFEATRSLADPLERVRAGVRAYFRFFDEHRELIDVFAHERSEFRDRVEPSFLVFRDQNTAQLEAELEQMKRLGLVREIDTKLVASLFVDMLGGAVYTHYRLGTGKLADRADEVLDVFLRGIVRHGPLPWRPSEPGEAT